MSNNEKNEAIEDEVPTDKLKDLCLSYQNIVFHEEALNLYTHLNKFIHHDTQERMNNDDDFKLIDYAHMIKDAMDQGSDDSLDSRLNSIFNANGVKQ